MCFCHIIIIITTTFFIIITLATWATAQSRTHEQVVQQALEVMLQQPLAEAWDIKTLCSLLQVSTACRKAVFDSGVSCGLSPQHFAASDSSAASLQRIMRFASWLPSHAPLVSSLELRAPRAEADTAVAEELLTLAVKLCAQQQASPSQALTPTGLIQPLAGLRLQSLTASLLLQPAALAALASCSHLTNLCWQRCVRLSTPVLQALGHLTGLKVLELHIAAGGLSQQEYTQLGASLAKLQQLEVLKCTGSGGLALSCLPQLPCSLVRLVMGHLPCRPADALGIFDVGHLTALQSLSAAWPWSISVASVLPLSLSHLKVAGGRIGADAPSLPRLVSLDMAVDCTQPVLLQHVHGMPLLRTLVVGLSLVGGVLRAPFTEGHVQVVAAALAAATQVTRLELYRDHSNSSLNMPHQDDAVLLLRNSLLQMRALSSLLVDGIRLDSRDVLRWTSLSALTSLTVGACSDFADTAVAALACKLPSLQHLDVTDCALHSSVLWPALACCTGLKELALRGAVPQLQDETLLYLTSLTQLTTLVLLGSAVQPSPAAVQQFRAAMPQLRDLHGL